MSETPRPTEREQLLALVENMRQVAQQMLDLADAYTVMHLSGVNLAQVRVWANQLAALAAAPQEKG